MIEADLDRRAVYEAIRRGEQILIEIRDGQPNGILGFVQAARREAVEAMTALVGVDPEQPAEIRRLQNEVRRYYDLRSWVKGILDTSKEARDELEGEEYADMEAHFVAEFGAMVNDA